MGRPFKPGETRFDYRERQNILWKRKWASRSETDKLLNFTARLSGGGSVQIRPARRLVRIDLSLDTEGLTPVADGGDLVAVVATLADDVGTPKRYDTETIRFSVDGAADIVGENPQVTRWGEAIVLLRPRASNTPKPIRIRAETMRHGKYAPKSGELVFTPGVPGVKTASGFAGDAADDIRLRQVEKQQAEFEAKD